MKKNILASAIAFALSVSLVGYANAETNYEISNLENCQGNDVVDINDNAALVAKVMGVDLTKMFADAFAVGGDIMAPRYNLHFMFKNGKEADARKTALDAFNKYMKSVATDGKIYGNKALSKEWNGEMFEDAEGEMIYVKIGDYGWSIQTVYGTTNLPYTDDKQYPYFTLRMEKFKLK